jgi:hypothetical protein
VIDGINELNREVKCLSMNLRAQSDCEPFFLLLIHDGDRARKFGELLTLMLNCKAKRSPARFN